MFQSRKWSRDSEAAQQFGEGRKDRDTNILPLLGKCRVNLSTLGMQQMLRMS